MSVIAKDEYLAGADIAETASKLGFHCVSAGERTFLGIWSAWGRMSSPAVGSLVEQEVEREVGERS